jgi:hypothetical protein
MRELRAQRRHQQVAQDMQHARRFLSPVCPCGGVQPRTATSQEPRNVVAKASGVRLSNVTSAELRQLHLQRSRELARWDRQRERRTQRSPRG